MSPIRITSRISGMAYNEAQLVYNFALPPLVLHTFRTGDSSILSQWSSKLDLPSERTTFFNFLASHDGIGLNPAPWNPFTH